MFRLFTGHSKCINLLPSLRFTTYDFAKMRRKSYYPQNQQLISQITATSSTGFNSSRPATPNMTDRDYAELAHQAVGIRGLSIDSHDPMHRPRTTDDYGEYSMDTLPIKGIIQEKERDES